MENALLLASSLRSTAFGGERDEPGLFTFAEAFGSRRILGADAGTGTARTTLNGYGALGGVGFGGEGFALGGFVGTLAQREELRSLGAETKADGLVAGVHAQVNTAGLDLSATVAYDGGRADTVRLVPGAATSSRYDLRGLSGDVSLAFR